MTAWFGGGGWFIFKVWRLMANTHDRGVLVKKGPTKLKGATTQREAQMRRIKRTIARARPARASVAPKRAQESQEKLGQQQQMKEGHQLQRQHRPGHKGQRTPHRGTAGRALHPSQGACRTPSAARPPKLSSAGPRPARTGPTPRAKKQRDGPHIASEVSEVRTKLTSLSGDEIAWVPGPMTMYRRERSPIHSRQPGGKHNTSSECEIDGQLEQGDTRCAKPHAGRTWRPMKRRQVTSTFS